MKTIKSVSLVLAFGLMFTVKAQNTSLAFSPDGKTIAISSGKEIELVDANSFSVRPELEGTPFDTIGYQVIKKFLGHTIGVKSVVYSPDGKTIASGGGYDKTIRIWDVESGKVLRTFSGHAIFIRSIAFSPDGSKIISAGGLLSGKADYTMKMWDAASGKILKEFKGHSASVESVAFSPDGRTIASRSEDDTVLLWDAISGKKLKAFTLNAPDSISAFAFSIDGRILAVGGYGAIKLLDVTSGNELRSFPGGIHQKLAFSPDGKTLASADSYGEMLFRDFVSGQLLESWTPIDGDRIKGFPTAIAFSPDGKSLVLATEDRMSVWRIPVR